MKLGEGFLFLGDGTPLGPCAGAELKLCDETVEAPDEDVIVLEDILDAEYLTEE